MTLLAWLLRKLARPFAALLLLLAAIGGPAVAQEPIKPLRVAVYDVQPYGGQGRDGMFSGASVDLWRRVAEKINRPYQLTLVGQMEEILSGVQNGTYDVAIGDITITAERLERVDFTYPAHRSGDAAVFAKQTGAMAALSQYAEALSDLGPLLAGILLFLAVTGVVMWWFERSRPGGPPQDPQSTVTSWHEGIYWAVVTMTTVGYGDKTPKTAAGRVIAMIWMVASLVIVSLLTTALIAHITVNQVQGGGETQPSDLSGKKLGAVAASSGAEYLEDQHFAYQKFANLSQALDALAAGKVNAVVNSVGALQYLVSLRYPDTIASPNGLLARGYIGFVLPRNSPLRYDLDRALVIVTASPEWRSVEDTYFNK